MTNKEILAIYNSSEEVTGATADGLIYEECYTKKDVLKAMQIARLEEATKENKSILKMAITHMDDRAQIVIKQRINDIYNQIDTLLNS